MREVPSCPLVAENIVLARNGRDVLHGVDAAFRRGAVTAVVGPSGAGKTSLLRCLNRLEEPSAGRVLLEGNDIRSLGPSELRRRVGMIFQTPVILEGGVRANLAYGLEDVSEATLAEALVAAGLPETFLDRESSALSVGQAQRVCIARALVRDPAVLLLDEPTSALDKDAAAVIESLLRRLSDRGLTLALVTHNLAQAKRVADEAVLLVDGRVIEVGELGRIEAAWPGEP
jgi:putative ABC transport system ATP-binding protein